MVLGNNSTYYLGWRYRLSSTVNNNAQFQWKVFPAPGPAGLNWPLALKVVNNRAVMLNRKGINSDGSYEVYEIWSHPISANTWYEMVLNLRERPRRRLHRDLAERVPADAARRDHALGLPAV
jgi:hypothetical protein